MRQYKDVQSRKGSFKWLQGSAGHKLLIKRVQNSMPKLRDSMFIVSPFLLNGKVNINVQPPNC